MTDRRHDIRDFVNSVGWADAVWFTLAGDASARKYLRLRRPGGQTAVLMDAPPASCGSQKPFLRIGAHLRGLGLAAPGIYAADLGRGLLLVEDFGDALFARLARQSPDTEAELYHLAVDVLLRLDRPGLPGLAEMTPDALADLVLPAFPCYANTPETAQDVLAFHDAFKQQLRQAGIGPDSLVLRDYHAENLVLRPHQSGVSRVGLLDFQDALLGPGVYDLVSLLQDARRDLATGLEDIIVNRVIADTGVDRGFFRMQYNLIAVQRHLRILGVFARLGRTQGKTRYLQFVPRTWKHLQKALRFPGLDGLAARLARLIPSPTANHLAWLERKGP